MMKHTTSLSMLLLILLFSDSLQKTGSTRVLNLKLSFDVVNYQDIIDSRSDEELEEGRMLIGTDDYPGTGANPHHDPKTPGTR